MDFDWTDEAIADLRRLRADGEPFSACARYLSGKYKADCTRNAVIGKAAREGISGNTDRRTFGPRPKLPRKPRRVRIAPPVKPPELDPEPEATDLPPDTSPFACTLLDLTEDTCRWPLGDPADPAFRFCGGPPVKGHSYCGRHCRIAYAKHRPNPALTEQQKRGIAAAGSFKRVAA